MNEAHLQPNWSQPPKESPLDPSHLDPSRWHVCQSGTANTWFSKNLESADKTLWVEWRRNWTWRSWLSRRWRLSWPCFAGDDWMRRGWSVNEKVMIWWMIRLWEDKMGYEDMRIRGYEDIRKEEKVGQRWEALTNISQLWDRIEGGDHLSKGFL